MRVKIKQCSNPDYGWYADKIGQEFDVCETSLAETWWCESAQDNILQSDCTMLTDVEDDGSYGLRPEETPFYRGQYEKEMVKLPVTYDTDGLVYVLFDADGRFIAQLPNRGIASYICTTLNRFPDTQELADINKIPVSVQAVWDKMPSKHTMGNPPIYEKDVVIKALCDVYFASKWEDILTEYISKPLTETLGYKEQGGDYLYKIDFKKVAGGYVGSIPEVAGVMSQGNTLDELKANLKDALRAITIANHVDASLKSGLDLKKLETELDKALDAETPESLTKWLDEQCSKSGDNEKETQMPVNWFGDKEAIEAFKSFPMGLLNEETAQRNYDCSLQQIAERGGMHPREMLANILHKSYGDVSSRSVEYAVNRLMAQIRFGADNGNIKDNDEWYNIKQIVRSDSNPTVSIDNLIGTKTGIQCDTEDEHNRIKALLGYTDMLVFYWSQTPCI